VSRLDTVNARRKSEAQHEARMREQQLHGWSRAKKEALIRGDIETLKQLSKKKDLS
jgi:predicted GIY-YIG superfamily endonuclease